MIRVYDLNLNRKGYIENFYSLIWSRNYYESGKFELHCPLTSDNMDLLQEDRIIAKDNTVESGIIENIEYQDYSKKIIVKGRFLSSLLERRLIKSTFSFNGLTEVAMHNLVDYVTPIPNLHNSNLEGFDNIVTFQATMKNLLTIMTKLSKTSNIGYRIKADFVDKKLYFQTYEGTDRTINKQNRVIFSEEYGNLTDISYSYNGSIYKSKAIVGGEGEGSNRVYVEVGSGEGYDLREVFVDAKDIRSSDFSSNDDYLNALRQKGYEKLSTFVKVDSFDYQINNFGNFKYKENYDLGDIVTIQKKDWGITLNKRITGIEEVYENGGMTLTATLGDPIPEKINMED